MAPRAKLISISALFAAVLFAVPSHSMVISYTDTEFVDASWSVVEALDTTPNNSFTFSGTQILSGGNPGAYRQVVNQINTGTASSIISGHFRSDMIYNPGTDGAFGSIDVSFDAISFPGTPAGGIAFGVILRQSGNFFINTSSVAVNGLGWTSFSSSGLTGADFNALGGGTLDLTNGAAAVEIGIFASNGTFGFPSVNTGGFDNLSLDVNVPEPGTLAIFSAALIALGATRRTT